MGQKQQILLGGIILIVVVAGIFMLTRQETPAQPEQNNQNGGQAESESDGFMASVDGRITGIEPGAGIMINTEKAVEEYGLADAGWSLQASSSAAMLSSLQEAFENEEPILATVWEPHSAFAIGNLRKLEDPNNIYNKPSQTTAFLEEHAPDWADAEVASDVIATVVYSGFNETAPAAYGFFENFNVDAGTQSQWIYDYNVNDLSPEQVAENFIAENGDMVDEWTPEDAELGQTELTIGIPPWPGATVKSRVVKQILEGMGYTVDVKEMDVGVVYTSIDQQQVDATVAGWLPTTHGQYWDQLGENLEIAGINVTQTWLGLAVPDYVDESIQSLEDLTK